MGYLQSVNGLARFAELSADVNMRIKGPFGESEFEVGTLLCMTSRGTSGAGADMSSFPACRRFWRKVWGIKTVWEGEGFCARVRTGISLAAERPKGGPRGAGFVEGYQAWLFFFRFLFFLGEAVSGFHVWGH